MALFNWISKKIKGKPASSAPQPSTTISKPPPGFRYLRATSVLQLENFPFVQQAIDSGTDIFHSDDEPPALILFISHRWESITSPDPRSQQLKAIQYMLKYIPEVAAALKLPAAQRIKKLPSIRIHGVIQAALLLGSTDSSIDDEDNIWQSWASVVKEKNADELLNHIGIWYDYSCMPQVTADLEKRTAGEMFDNLIKLPDLVRSSVILMLREKGDDYSERGWCAAEVAAARRDNQLIVLRKDLLGTSISNQDLSAVAIDETDNMDENLFESSGLFRYPLNKWESKEEDQIGLWNLYLGLRDVKVKEESRDFPLITTKRNPDAFPQQKALLIYFISFWENLSAIDAKHGSLDGAVDLESSIINLMKQVGLKCTESWDLVFVCLSIMRSRHHPKLVPYIELFYRTATERWIKGESIKLVRFREQRKDPYSWEVWYLFEGESPDARAKPGWVK